MTFKLNLARWLWKPIETVGGAILWIISTMVPQEQRARPWSKQVILRCTTFTQLDHFQYVELLPDMDNGQCSLKDHDPRTINSAVQQNTNSAVQCNVVLSWSSLTSSQFVTKQSREVKQSLLHCTFWKALTHIFVQSLVFLAQVMYTVHCITSKCLSSSLFVLHGCSVFTCSAYMIYHLTVCAIACCSALKTAHSRSEPW